MDDNDLSLGETIVTIEDDSDVGITCCENVPSVFSTFKAILNVPHDSATVVRPGTWLVQVYYSNGSEEVVIETRALAYLNCGWKRVTSDGANMPLRELGMGGVYWKLQKIMQRRMDNAIKVNK